MIVPDPTGRQECCGAMTPTHFVDCPTKEKRELARRDEAVRELHKVTVLNCLCGLCQAMATE